MTTLRREAIQKVFDVLIGDFGHIIDTDQYDEYFTSVAVKIVDRLYEMRGFSLLKEEPIKNADPYWELFHGIALSQEEVDRNRFIDAALNEFNFCLQIQMEWHPAKSSKEIVMKTLREKVVEWYAESKDCFRDYQTWRTQPFARGAMSNVQIKNFPENFAASWSDFRRAVPLHSKTQRDTTETDGEIYI